MGKLTVDAKFAAMSLTWNVPDESEYASWLEEVRECGYDGITGFAHWGMAGFVERPQRLRNLLDQAGLRLASMDVTHYDNLDEYKRICECLAMNGSDNMVYIDPKGGPKEYEALGERLNRVGEISQAYGVKTLYHNHTRGIGERYAEVERVYQATDPNLVAMMLDLGHATKDFIDLPLKERATTFLRKYWSRIRFMEFKDWNEITDLNTPLGEGYCDYETVFRLMHDEGYTGWITVEQNGNDGYSLGRTPKQSAIVSRKFIREHSGI